MTAETHHFTPMAAEDAELLLPMLEPICAANPTDYESKCRIADCLLALGDTENAIKIYEGVRNIAPDIVHAHAALLYLMFRDHPAVQGAINLPLRLRTIHGQQMLVWYAFPDTNEELRQFPYYNRMLGKLAEVLKQKYPGLTIMDVGANIGQSVAEVYAYAPAPCLSIEVGQQNFALCYYNTKRISAENEAVQALVGPEGLHGSLQYARSFDMPGAQKPEWIYMEPVAADADGAVPTVALTTLIKHHPKWANSKLVKIDAEGWDWQIIQDSKSFWASARPVIYFEHNFEYAKADRQAGHTQSLAAIQTLLDCGYTHFLVQDGRGHMITQVTADHINRFHEINLHLYMLIDVHTGVHYFDITAVHADDAGLVDEIYRASLSGELRRIKKPGA